MVAHNLPLQPTPFVGRTEELAEITALLNNPACRLLTLVGPGGIGKTRLALEAAVALFNRNDATFHNGIYFVSLQPLTSPDFILSALAEAIGLRFYPGDEPLPQLIDYLCPQTALLVLDNFEHLLEGVQIVSDLLTDAPNIKILATSRETLNLQEEWLYQVQGMSFPKGEDDNLKSYAAVQLFVQSAQRVRPTFSLAAERRAVLRICQMVEGMPLALEMTAAWLKRLPAQGVVREIERGLDILESPARNVLPRHRSMRAVFEHSWNLLTDAEKDGFKKLSVFRGGFRKEAASAVAGALLRILSALVDKSLLRVDDTGRYDMHELVRQFGEEQLNISSELSHQTHDLHGAYFMDFLAQRRDDVAIRQTKAVMSELLDEFENIRVAWEWAVEERKIEQIQKACGPLCLLYDYRCMFSEAAEVFGKAVKKLRDRPGLILAVALNGQGWFAYFMSQYSKAAEIYEESLAIAQQEGDTGMMSYALMRLSEIALQTGNYDKARQLTWESFDYKKQENQQAIWEDTWHFAHLGKIAHLSGDYVEARQLFNKAITAGQNFDVPVGIADAQNFLGNLELTLQDYQAAREIFDENVAYQKRINYPRGELVSLIGLGEVARGLGEYQEARQFLASALRLAIQTHSISKVLDALSGISELWMQEHVQEPALYLLALVLHHPAANYETKDRAKALFAQLEDQLSPQSVSDAVHWYKTRQLEGLVQDLLDNQLSVQAVSPVGEQPTYDLLSKRELEVLRLLADGLSNREIAERLFLAVSTVKWHIGEIFSKLYVANRTQAVARARALKLLA